MNSTKEELLQDLLTLKEVFEIEDYWETPIDVHLDPVTTQDLIRCTSLLPPSSRKAFRGPNWFGIVDSKSGDKTSLFVYLPVEAVLKEVTVFLVNHIIFKGILEKDKIRIHFPVLPNYEFLETSLRINWK